MHWGRGLLVAQELSPLEAFCSREGQRSAAAAAAAAYFGG